MKWPLFFAVPLACAILVSCDAGPSRDSTITLAHANQRAEHYVREAAALFPAWAILELQESFEDYPCTDPDGVSQDGRRIASRTFQVRGPAKAEIPRYFDAVVTWSKRHDFVVLQHEPPNEYLWMQNESDGFRLSLEANRKGELYLGATSPCVWPTGTSPE